MKLWYQHPLKCLYISVFLNSFFCFFFNFLTYFLQKLSQFYDKSVKPIYSHAIFIARSISLIQKTKLKNIVWKIYQSVYKPGSVLLNEIQCDGHSSCATVTNCIMQPTRTTGLDITGYHPRRSYLVLLPMGFSMPQLLPIVR